jgi:hypothetical protein
MSLPLPHKIIGRPLGASQGLKSVTYVREQVSPMSVGWTVEPGMTAQEWIPACAGMTKLGQLYKIPGQARDDRVERPWVKRPGCVAQK